MELLNFLSSPNDLVEWREQEEEEEVLDFYNTNTHTHTQVFIITRGKFVDSLFLLQTLRNNLTLSLRDSHPTQLMRCWRVLL